MDALNSDLLLHIIQYLAIPDSGRLAASSKRFLFLVRGYQKLLGPQLVASSSKMHQICTDAIQQLQSTPNLALYFGKANYGTTLPETQLHEFLPPHAIQLGVNAASIQCCVSPEIECSSSASLMLASFPDATIVPFLLDDKEQIEMTQVLQTNDTFDVKVCMIFACGANLNYSKLESTIQLVQTKYPEATIVGGVCSSGFISFLRTEFPNDIAGMSLEAFNEIMMELGVLNAPVGHQEQQAMVEHVQQMIKAQGQEYFAQTVEEGIFGILMGGDVPVRSVVSRGMHSMTFKGPPRCETPFFVQEAQFLRPGDDGYIFPDASAPPYHQITRVVDRSSGKVYTYTEMMREFGRASLVGIRDHDEDGFTLCNVHQLSSMNIDLFEINGEACLQDMDLRMQQLQDALKEEELLGALMISCNGRGPAASQLIPEEMADAKRFQKAFPHVPCLGFYAGGEIGPLAQAARKEVFQFGKAALQGFTVVFAVFVAPKIDRSAFHIDDSENNVNVFAKEYFDKGQ